MIKLDEDALICDLAETYGIYDYRQLPVKRVAVFCCGLKEDSRIRMKMNRQKVPLETLLLGSIFDRLSLILWSKTVDGQKGVNRPSMIMEKLIDIPRENDTVAFSSGEEFMKMRQRLIEQGGES